MKYSLRSNSFLAISSQSTSTANSRDSHNYVSAGLNPRYAAQGATPKENTAPQQSLYCYRGVLTSPLHRNGTSSVAACVCISAGTCLPSHCLAMNVCSGSTIPVLRRHVTICFRPLDLLPVPSYAFGPLTCFRSLHMLSGSCIHSLHMLAAS
jgi:hypothetical protein